MSVLTHKCFLHLEITVQEILTNPLSVFLELFTQSTRSTHENFTCNTNLITLTFCSQTTVIHYKQNDYKVLPFLQKNDTFLNIVKQFSLLRCCRVLIVKAMILIPFVNARGCNDHMLVTTHHSNNAQCQFNALASNI